MNTATAHKLASKAWEAGYASFGTNASGADAFWSWCERLPERVQDAIDNRAGDWTFDVMQAFEEGWCECESEKDELLDAHWVDAI